jgi:hypothetical protein
MENMIVMVNAVGATVHNVDENNAVIIFNEIQLLDFMNDVARGVKKEIIESIYMAEAA